MAGKREKQDFDPERAKALLTSRAMRAHLRDGHVSPEAVAGKMAMVFRIEGEGAARAVWPAVLKAYNPSGKSARLAPDQIEAVEQLLSGVSGGGAEEKQDAPAAIKPAGGILELSLEPATNDEGAKKPSRRGKGQKPVRGGERKGGPERLEAKPGAEAQDVPATSVTPRPVTPAPAILPTPRPVLVKPPPETKPLIKTSRSPSPPARAGRREESRFGRKGQVLINTLSDLGVRLTLLYRENLQQKHPEYFPQGEDGPDDKEAERVSVLYHRIRTDLERILQVIMPECGLDSGSKKPILDQVLRVLELSDKTGKTSTVKLEHDENIYSRFEGELRKRLKPEEMFVKARLTSAVEKEEEVSGDDIEEEVAVVTSPEPVAEEDMDGTEVEKTHAMLIDGAPDALEVVAEHTREVLVGKVKTERERKEKLEEIPGAVLKALVRLRHNYLDNEKLKQQFPKKPLLQRESIFGPSQLEIVSAGLALEDMKKLLQELVAVEEEYEFTEAELLQILEGKKVGWLKERGITNDQILAVAGQGRSVPEYIEDIKTYFRVIGLFNKKTAGVVAAEEKLRKAEAAEKEAIANTRAVKDGSQAIPTLRGPLEIDAESAARLAKVEEDARQAAAETQVANERVRAISERPVELDPELEARVEATYEKAVLVDMAARQAEARAQDVTTQSNAKIIAAEEGARLTEGSAQEVVADAQIRALDAEAKAQAARDRKAAFLRLKDRERLLESFIETAKDQIRQLFEIYIESAKEQGYKKDRAQKALAEEWISDDIEVVIDSLDAKWSTKLSPEEKDEIQRSIKDDIEILAK